MPRPRYDNVDSEKKNKLLKAAMTEFAEHGYELASINRILENAGLSKGSFYYYFDDKADLGATVYGACVEHEVKVARQLTHGLRDPKNIDEFWPELHRISLVMLREMDSNRLEYSCLVRLYNAIGNDPAFAARIPKTEHEKNPLVGFLEKGVSIGALRNDLPLGTVMALIEAVKAAAYKAHFPGDRMPSDAEIEKFSDVVLDLARRVAAPKEKP